jgi:hypothetical protein
MPDSRRRRDIQLLQDARGANLGLVRSLGADEVVDYCAENFTRHRPYDVIIDNVGNHSLRALRRALTQTGTLVAVGGGMSRKLGTKLLSRFIKQRLAGFIANVNKADMIVLKELIESGKVAGHRSDLTAQRGPGGDPLRRDRPRARQGHHHCLIETCPTIPHLAGLVRGLDAAVRVRRSRRAYCPRGPRSRPGLCAKAR